jgi:hypothetical protein
MGKTFDPPMTPLLYSNTAGKKTNGAFLIFLVLLCTVALACAAGARSQGVQIRLRFSTVLPAAADANSPKFLEKPPVVHPSQTATGDSALPQKLGWYEIPNTALASACPDIPEIQAVEGCKAVIADWAGGLADTKRNRLLLWGGGHNGYFGNEWYALDLNKLTMQRITEPSTGAGISNLKDCPEAYTDGKPNARHTYNGLQYLAKQDLYFLLGGGLSPCGYFSNVVWTFDPASTTWTKKNPKIHPNPAQNGSLPMTAVESTTGMIYEVEVNVGLFWQYDAVADVWKNLGQVSACPKLNMTASIDSSRKLYYCIGNNSFSKISLTGSHAAKTLRGSGCEELMAASAPGFDFDGSQNRMVGWAGGDTVYIYDVETDSCKTQSFPGGPGKGQAGGTYGRFRHFSTLGVFALVNDWKQNAFVLRMEMSGPRH